MFRFDHCGEDILGILCPHCQPIPVAVQLHFSSTLVHTHNKHAYNLACKQAGMHAGAHVMNSLHCTDLRCPAPTSAVLRVSWTGQSAEYWQGVLQGSQGGAAGVGAVLQKHGLPKRLADALCLEAGVTATPLAQLKKVTPSWVCFSLQFLCFSPSSLR